MALIIGGVVLWLVDRSPSTSQPAMIKLDSINKGQALTVGLVQCLALIPGVSRSGASIVGGLMGKMNRPTATAFSFYLGIPILIAAGMYKIAKDWNSIKDISGGGSSIVIGSIAAFITALIAVSWLLRYVSTHNFRLFAYYRVILGILVLILLL